MDARDGRNRSPRYEDEGNSGFAWASQRKKWKVRASEIVEPCSELISFLFSSAVKEEELDQLPFGWMIPRSR